MALFPAGVGGSLDASFSRGDPVDWLEEISPVAADRLHALRQHAADCRVMVPDSEEVRGLYADRAGFQNRIVELTKPAGLGGKGLAEDNPSVVRVQKQVDKLTAEIKRQTELTEIRSGRWQNAGQIVKRIEDWLKAGLPGGIAIQEHPRSPSPTFSKKMKPSPMRSSG